MSSVNAFVAWAGSFALFALAALVLGSFLLRLFGLATMLAPTVFLLSEANLNTADVGSYLVFVPMALLRLVVWVVGHPIHRAQHGWWKSPLSARLWTLPARGHRRFTVGDARRPGPDGSRRPVAYPPGRARSLSTPTQSGSILSRNQTRDTPSRRSPMSRHLPDRVHDVRRQVTARFEHPGPPRLEEDRGGPLLMVSAGPTTGPGQGGCLLAGEKWGDEPECTHPVIPAMARER